MPSDKNKENTLSLTFMVDSKTYFLIQQQILIKTPHKIEMKTIKCFKYFWESTKQNRFFFFFFFLSYDSPFRFLVFWGIFY